MKRVHSLFALFLLSTTGLWAQVATVTVTITSPAHYQGHVYIRDPLAKYDPSKRVGEGIGLDSHQSGDKSFYVAVPHTISLFFYYSLGKSGYTDQILNYAVFLTPGDDIHIKFDLLKKYQGILVTGKGSNNNQPMIQKLTDIYDDEAFRDDKLPGRAIAIINNQQKLNRELLDEYIAKYKPSEAFINASKANIAYYTAAKFFSFKTRNLDPARRIGLWEKAQDSIFANIPVKNDAFSSELTPVGKLNNDDALMSYNYQALLGMFLIREKERLWDESELHPKAFYKEWYHTNVKEGKKLMEAEAKSLLIEKIINRDFSGRTAEYMYACLLERNLYESYYQNIDVIFDHFKQKYPNSKYIAWFEQPIATVIKKQREGLNSKMVFVADNGSKLNSLKDVIALNKGKTVFIDMWGTWCSPCREDIEKDSEALRNHFKGKDIIFIYVANHDLKHEQEWKRLIAYYHMEGTHILANEKLTNSMMGSIKATGFPTYMIIKKDGSYKGAKSQYPLDMQMTANELQALL